MARLRHTDGLRKRLLIGVDRKLSVHGQNDANDPNVWSGRALQEDFVELAAAVLHQCIRPLIRAFVLRAIMDISARSSLARLEIPSSSRPINPAGPAIVRHASQARHLQGRYAD